MSVKCMESLILRLSIHCIIISTVVTLNIWQKISKISGIGGRPSSKEHWYVRITGHNSIIESFFCYFVGCFYKNYQKRGYNITMEWPFTNIVSLILLNFSLSQLFEMFIFYFLLHFAPLFLIFSFVSLFLFDFFLLIFSEWWPYHRQ